MYSEPFYDIIKTKINVSVYYFCKKNEFVELSEYISFIKIDCNR